MRIATEIAFIGRVGIVPVVVLLLQYPCTVPMLNGLVPFQHGG